MGAPERFFEVFEEEYKHYQNYHNHKERMAHFGFLLEVGLFSWFVAVDDWPPRWLVVAADKGQLPCSAATIALLVLCLVWFILNRYVRWQLEMRRFAAIQVAATMRLLRLWAAELPSEEELSVVTVEEDAQYVEAERKSMEAKLSGLGKRMGIHRIRTVLLWLARQVDKVVPCPVGFRTYDVSPVGCPRDFVELLRDQSKRGTGALTSEWLLAFASLAILAAAIARYLIA